MTEGLSDEEVVQRIIDDNLFQYPTEKSLKRIAQNCIRRLKCMDDETLVKAIATQPTDVAKQICLYAMMKQYRLVWDFMITVIGEKYRLRDTSFGRIDLNTFFLRLQEQDEVVASWSDTTITKLKQILARVLVENEYLDSTKATKLNPVWLNSTLENAIKDNGDDFFVKEQRHLFFFYLNLKVNRFLLVEFFVFESDFMNQGHNVAFTNT